MTALKTLAIKGVVWTVINFGASQVIRLAGNLVLTRLLVPEFFGLMTLVNTFIIGLNLFSDVGINISIIQNKRGEEPNFLNTAWTIQAVRGIVLMLVCLMLAHPFAAIYNKPDLGWMIPVMGLSTLAMGFSSTSLNVLERNLTLKKLTVLDITIQLIQMGIMIGWAWVTRSTPTIWSILGGVTIAPFIRMIASHFILPEYRNRFVWDASAAQEIIAIGRWVFISTAITFLAEQVDRLLLGKYFSLELLGIYSVAITLGDVPRQIGGALGAKVILPATSRVADLPRSELRQKLLRNRKLLLLPMLVVVGLLIGVGDLVVSFLYDERYTAARWMLPILAIGVWPRILLSSIEPVLFAVGKLHYSTIANISRFLMTAIGIPLGYTLLEPMGAGPVGAVMAVALNDVGYYCVANYGLWREKLSGLRQDLISTALLALFVAVILWIRHMLGFGFPMHELLRLVSLP